MGETIADHLTKSSAGDGIRFPHSLYTADICDEVVESVVDFQRRYGGRSEQITDRLDRYRKLLEKATGDVKQVASHNDKRAPAYTLCPYFAVRSLSDKWWQVMLRIWNSAEKTDNSAEISPVVSITDVFSLQQAFEYVPSALSPRMFFWIPSFDERRAPASHLRQLKQVVETSSAQNYELINLYGGYFSILLGKFGLTGFNNGLGYSESRAWPTLGATGAAPAQYYMRRLHTYLPPATATAMIDIDSAFSCSCRICSNGKRPNDLSYHELKQHFALARAWEIERSESCTVQDLCEAMRDDANRSEVAKRSLPGSLRIPTDHLSQWADALES